MAAIITLDGNSRGAVDALKKVETQASKTDRSLNLAGNAAMVLTAGMQAMGVASRAMQRIVDVGRAGIEAYAEANSDVASRLDGTRQAMDEFTASIGEAILGGENLEVITGALNAVLGEMQGHVEGNSAATQDLARGAMASLVEGIGMSGRVMAVAINTLRVFKIAFGAVRLGVLALVTANVALGASLFQAVIQPARLAMRGLMEMAGGAAGFARALGRDGLAASLESAQAAFQGLGDGTDRFNEQMVNLRQGALRDLSDATASYAADVADTTEAMFDTSEMALSFDDRMSAVAETVRDGTVASRSRAAAVRESSTAIEVENAKLAEQVRIREKLQDQAAMDEIMWAKEEQRRQEAMEAELQRRALEAEAELAQKQKMQDALDREQAARAGLADGAVAAFSKIATGNDKLVAASQIAEATLMGVRAISHGLQGAAMVLQPGNQAQGAALIAVAIAEAAQAAKLGATGVQGLAAGGGAAAAGGGGGDRIFAPNISITGGDGGDARSTASMVEQAVRRQYLQLESAR